ncbi:ATP-binding protein [Pseudanabaena sp. 'Roaring Creek']|uniref:ATP-binding protein n=1 Tax=Pseudanabaena sp. 'Roaring Creek' TaxID=1681830 RepID=UPI0006D7C6B6|nr:ATP-binding protein [Pseudanabaena sp. 'Roaring Creek']
MSKIQDLTDIKWTQDTICLYERAINATNCGVVICDASLPDTPIIYCNPAFEKITGYLQVETIGYNCRFLQGIDTDSAALNYLRASILNERECQVILKNYRKDGTTFWNELYVSPLRDEEGLVTHFIGIQTDISSRIMADEIIHQKVEHEKLINAISNKIRRSLELSEILNNTVQEVRQFLQTDRVAIYKFAADMSGMIVSESVLPGWTVSFQANVEDTCFQGGAKIDYVKGKKRAINDIYNAGLSECHIKLLEQFEVKANLVVPIITKNHPSEGNVFDHFNQHEELGSRLWGLLIAHQCSGTRNWLESELNLLDKLSGQIAIAIYQSDLYQRVQIELQERRQTEIALRKSEAKTSEQAEKLAQALEKLKQTQLQLIQTEKMSSLGQLVAGIAHEINNPVSFIHGNISYAQEYIQHLLHLLGLYQKHYPQPVASIQSELEEIDLNYVIADLDKVLSSIVVGTDRIRKIILSLRNFARLDEAEVKQVDIHEGIDSTLLILQHRIRSVGKNSLDIEVIKEQGNLPLIECYPSQLNQVFMNLLSNAIDALEEFTLRNLSKVDLTYVPTILIHTSITANNTVRVQITDNAGGIPESVQSRIFDPFFTTKPIGKGIGLGLSISYQIVVKRHNGTINCISKLGEGTTFSIEIPIK